MSYINTYNIAISIYNISIDQCTHIYNYIDISLHQYLPISIHIDMPTYRSTDTAKPLYQNMPTPIYQQILHNPCIWSGKLTRFIDISPRELYRYRHIAIPIYSMLLWTCISSESVRQPCAPPHHGPCMSVCVIMCSFGLKTWQSCATSVCLRTTTLIEWS